MMIFPWRAGGSVMLRGDIWQDGGFNRDFWSSFTAEGCLKIGLPIIECAATVLLSPDAGNAIAKATDVAGIVGMELNFGSIELEACAYVTTLGSEDPTCKPDQKSMGFNPGIRGQGSFEMLRTTPWPDCEMKCTTTTFKEPRWDWRTCTKWGVNYPCADLRYEYVDRQVKKVECRFQKSYMLVAWCAVVLSQR
jgi:hypothetical protein